jgi:hypothetical protein
MPYVKLVVTLKPLTNLHIRYIRYNRHGNLSIRQLATVRKQYYRHNRYSIFAMERDMDASKLQRGGALATFAAQRVDHRQHR